MKVCDFGIICFVNFGHHPLRVQDRVQRSDIFDPWIWGQCVPWGSREPLRSHIPADPNAPQKPLRTSDLATVRKIYCRHRVKCVSICVSVLFMVWVHYIIVLSMTTRTECNICVFAVWLITVFVGVSAGNHLIAVFCVCLLCDQMIALFFMQRQHLCTTTTLTKKFKQQDYKLFLILLWTFLGECGWVNE